MDEGKQDENESGSGDGVGTLEERRICATQPRRAAGVMWKTRKTWAEEENNKTRKYWFSSCQPRSVSTIAPSRTVDCMKEKMKNIHRYRRPN